MAVRCVYALRAAHMPEGKRQLQGMTAHRSCSRVLPCSRRPPSVLCR